MWRNYLTCLLLLVSSIQIKGQDVAQFGQKSNYGWSGGLQVGYQFYKSLQDSNNLARFAPNGYSIVGHLNIRLGAVQIPLSVNFNNVQGSISNPFNLYGASPYYKWIKLHLGHRALSFSPYVYAGRSFNGIGLELTPGKLRFAAFHGKLQNLLAVSDSAVTGGLVLPNYQRKITGAKLGFGKSANYFELVGVRVKDHYENDIRAFASPQENLVLGSNLKLRFFKKLFFQLQAGASLFTNNQNATQVEALNTINERLNGLHTINISSRYSFAGDASLGFHDKKYGIELKYKRVEPFYYSIATNYVQNDLENYTINLNLKLLKSKLRLRGSFGLQRDNLSNFKSFTSHRTIGSVTANYFSGQRFQLLVNYSNYQHENQSGLAVVNDTVRILTNTNNLIVNTSYQYLKSNKWDASANVYFFNNRVVDDTDFKEFKNDFTGLGFTTALHFTWKVHKLTFTPNVNYNKYQFFNYNTSRTTAGINISKTTEDKKWVIGTSILYGINHFNQSNNGTLLNLSANIRFQWSKKHQLGARVIYLDNQTVSTPALTEVRGQVYYSFTFK